MKSDSRNVHHILYKVQATAFDNLIFDREFELRFVVHIVTAWHRSRSDSLWQCGNVTLQIWLPSACTLLLWRRNTARVQVADMKPQQATALKCV